MTKPSPSLAGTDDLSRAEGERDVAQDASQAGDVAQQDIAKQSDPQRANALRMAALVAFVWTIAALPFATGLASCPTARFFHFACPGCGMTRAFQFLVAGQAEASFAMHPLAVPTGLSQIALAIASIVATVRFGAPWLLIRARWGRVVVGFVAITMVLDLVLWIARMLGAFGGSVPV